MNCWSVCACPCRAPYRSVNGQSRERLQCRLRHYMHFLSPAKRSAAALATSVCELRHGGLRGNLHAGCKNRMNACAASVHGAENTLFGVRADSVTVGKSYSTLPPDRGPVRGRVARLGRDPRERRRFISCALDPAVRFEKCMHAGGARSAPRATKCSAGSRIRSPPPQSTPPRLRQVGRSDSARVVPTITGAAMSVDTVDTSLAKLPLSVHARSARPSLLRQAPSNAAPNAA